MFNAGDFKMSKVEFSGGARIGKLYKKISCAGDCRMMMKHLRCPWTWGL